MIYFTLLFHTTSSKSAVYFAFTTHLIHTDCLSRAAPWQVALISGGAVLKGLHVG